MSYFNRNKGWALAFILLIALNVATLLTFWLVRERRQGPPMMSAGITDFLTKELSFDSAQQQQLKELLLEHQQQIHDIRRGSREAKDAFFSLLKERSISDAAVDSAALLAARYDAQTDVLTFRHFRKIRALCTPAQQEKFDHIIQQVLHMMAPPPGPPRNGRPGDEAPHGEHHGPPPGDGPPGGEHDGPPPQQRP